MYFSKRRKETSENYKEMKLQPNISSTAITKEENNFFKKLKNNSTNNKYKKAAVENYNRVTTTVITPRGRLATQTAGNLTVITHILSTMRFRDFTIDLVESRH